jgi:hypothetical protein
LFYSAICDAGRFFSESSCKPCERGTYKENVGDARFEDCTICPDGKTTENSGAVSESLCTLRMFQLFHCNYLYRNKFMKM